MMATVPHVTSGSGLRKFQADGFLLDSVQRNFIAHNILNGLVVRVGYSDMFLFSFVQGM